MLCVFSCPPSHANNLGWVLDFWEQGLGYGPTKAVHSAVLQGAFSLKKLRYLEI